MKLEILYHLFVFVVVSNLIIVMAITQTRDADVLNLNGIPDEGATREKSGTKPKDASVTESQENRSFFKPDADRRGGSFYPSGPPLSPSSPSYHTSGNGYSYGAPSGTDYYGGGFSGRPSAPGGPAGPGGSGPYGAGLGGGHPLVGGGGNPHQHAMALKGLLLPIAGVALLGAAAVLAKSNPVLLQLGVVGKRRRRHVDYYPINPYVKPETQ